MVTVVVVMVVVVVPVVVEEVVVVVVVVTEEVVVLVVVVVDVVVVMVDVVVVVVVVVDADVLVLTTSHRSPLNPSLHLHSNAAALAWFNGHRTVTHSTPATYSAVPFKLVVCPQLNAHSRSHTSSPNTVGISKHSLLSAQSRLLLQAASSSAHMSVQLKRLSRHVPPLLHGLGSQRA